MRIPVNKPYRDGRGYGQVMWYGIHRGKDYLPHRRGRHQTVFAPEDGVVSRYIGGACAGVDLRGVSGNTHRLCHLHNVPRLGERFKEGDKIGTMGNRGLSTGVHLHWAAVDKYGRTINPLDLIDESDPMSEVKELFKKVWKRDPAKGEMLTFYYRFKNGKTMDWVKNNMKYWYGVVYPGGKLDKEGDKRWQRHKAKILKKYGDK